MIRADHHSRTLSLLLDPDLHSAIDRAAGAELLAAPEWVKRLLADLLTPAGQPSQQENSLAIEC